MEAGFARVEEHRNTTHFAPEDVDVLRFLRDELGLAVAIPRDAAGPTPAELITRALDASAPIDPAIQRVIEDFFASFRDAKSLDEPVRLLAFRALADPRVAAPRETWTLVRATEKAGDAIRAELARILFAKLMTTDPARREDHPSYLGWPIAYVANSIAMLPPQLAMPYRRELEQVARDPARRKRAYRALPQLSVFGADAVPTLLFLVEEAISLRANEESRPEKPGDRREDWQATYGSGLAGLCRLGKDGSAALEPLMARLRDGTLPVGMSNGDRLITTLTVLGADTEELIRLIAKDEQDRAIVKREIDRAKTRPDCVY
jgi:hypothetical protein